MSTWLVRLLVAGPEEAGERAVRREGQHATLGDERLGVFDGVQRPIRRQPAGELTPRQQAGQRGGRVSRRYTVLSHWFPPIPQALSDHLQSSSDRAASKRHPFA